jgi:hypothetical protein
MPSIKAVVNEDKCWKWHRQLLCICVSVTFTADEALAQVPQPKLLPEMETAQHHHGSNQ